MTEFSFLNEIIWSKAPYIWFELQWIFSECLNFASFLRKQTQAPEGSLLWCSGAWQQQFPYTFFHGRKEVGNESETTQGWENVHFSYKLKHGANWPTYSAVALQETQIRVPARGPFPIPSPSLSPTSRPVCSILSSHNKGKKTLKSISNNFHS